MRLTLVLRYLRMGGRGSGRVYDGLIFCNFFRDRKGRRRKMGRRRRKRGRRRRKRDRGHGGSLCNPE